MKNPAYFHPTTAHAPEMRPAVQVTEAIDLKSLTAAKAGRWLSSSIHQEAFTRFGEFALWADDQVTILNEACRLASAALDVPFAKILELDGEVSTMLVCGGYGWKPGIIGQARIPAGAHTAERHALETAKPVVVADINTDRRFDHPDFLREHGIRAIATVPIRGREGHPSFGVLQVDSQRPCEFTTTDVLFLSSYANLVAAAMERLRLLSEVRLSGSSQERLLHEHQISERSSFQMLASIVDEVASSATHPEVLTTLQSINDAVQAMRLVRQKGYIPGSGFRHACLGSYLAELTANLLATSDQHTAGRIRLMFDVERVLVPSSFLVSMGLIATEFMTNSFKHAFAGGRDGAVSLRIEVVADTVHVVFSNTGRQMPLDRGGGRGIPLIEQLAEQAGTTLQWNTEQGTQLSLSIPLDRVKCGPLCH